MKLISSAAGSGAAFCCFASAALGQEVIHAVVTPIGFGKEQTRAWIQPYEQVETHPPRKAPVSLLHPEEDRTFTWVKSGERFLGVTDEPMPSHLEQGDTAVL